MRIASLLPSATDTLKSLNALSLLVGRSHECDWPEVLTIPVCTANKVGDMCCADTDAAMSSSTAALGELAMWGAHMGPAMLEQGMAVYRVDLAKLQQMRPDVILTQLQDQGQRIPHAQFEAALQALLGYAPKVVHLAAANLAEVWQDMQKIADAIGKGAEGRRLVQQLKQRMEDPWYAAGSWVPELIALANGQDVLGQVKEAVHFSQEQLAGTKPDVLLFALCGFDLGQSVQMAKEAAQKLAAAGSKSIPALAHSRVAAVDGVKMFSRPGPLLVESLECLVELLHSEAQHYGHAGKLWQQVQLQGSS